MEETKEMRPRSPSHGVVCQNPHCGYYLQSEGKDIIRRGRNSAGHQRFQCRHCAKIFIETRGTPAYRKRLSIAKIARIYRLAAEGWGVHRIERFIGMHRDTIRRLLKHLMENSCSGKMFLYYYAGMNSFEINQFYRYLARRLKRPTNDGRNGQGLDNAGENDAES
ncbi:MAG: IS1 family transposase [Thermoplasmata archaeon]